MMEPDHEELWKYLEDEEDEEVEEEDCECVLGAWIDATQRGWNEYPELREGVVSPLDRLHVDEPDGDRINDEGRPRWTPPKPKPGKP